MLKTGVVVLLLIGSTTFVLRRQQENQRLMADLAALRQQIEQATTLQEENLRLAEQLKSGVQTHRPNRVELIPLRAQASRLRQLELENARLKSARQRLAPQTALAAQAQSEIEQSEQPPCSGECPSCHEAVSGELTHIDSPFPKMEFNGRCIPCGVDLFSDVSKTGVDMIIQWKLKP